MGENCLWAIFDSAPSWCPIVTTHMIAEIRSALTVGPMSADLLVAGLEAFKHGPKSRFKGQYLESWSHVIFILTYVILQVETFPTMYLV